MNKKKFQNMGRMCSRLLAVALALLVGCAGRSAPWPQARAEDMFSSRDYEASFDERKSALITLKGDTAACDSNAVSIEGGVVTLLQEGTYILESTLENGQICVQAGDNDKVQIVLRGAAVASPDSAALLILSADKVFLTLAPDTENTLQNGGGFAEDGSNVDGAVFSKCDLTLNGSGALTVLSPAGHGIVCKDDLKITGGTYTVSAASHGLDANDSVRMAAGQMQLSAGKDGIHAENEEDETKGFVYIAGGSLNIDAQGDGISASGEMRIEAGDFTITAGGGSQNAASRMSSGREFGGGFGGGFGGFGGRGMGGDGGRTRDRGQVTPPTGPDTEGNPPAPPENLPTAPEADAPAQDTDTSTKGVKAEGDMTLTGGTFALNTADDALHAGGSITISGGEFSIATGDDGAHADDTLTISGGRIAISESYEGLEALHLLVSGGEISLIAQDDGLNAAGGQDESGFGGWQMGDRFGRGGFGGSSSGGTLVISGGSLYIQASGDGMDANGSLEMTGGQVTVCGPTMGDTAILDYDTGGSITGGTFLGTGGSMMAQSFNQAGQGVIFLRAGNQKAGTEITLLDENGNAMLSLTPALDFNTLIFSAPEIVSGQSYTLRIGGNETSVTAR